MNRTLTDEQADWTLSTNWKKKTYYRWKEEEEEENKKNLEAAEAVLYLELGKSQSWDK